MVRGAQILETGTHGLEVDRRHPGSAYPIMRITRSVDPWLGALLLVPAVFGLALAAVVVAIELPASHGPSGGAALPAASVTTFEILLALPPAAGDTPVQVTVRVRLAPAVPPDAVARARNDAERIVSTLVASLPPGWTPDAAGMALLEGGINDAIPAAITPSLPPGTRTSVSVEVTGGARPSP